jgi:hypothetical protein
MPVRSRVYAGGARGSNRHVVLTSKQVQARSLPSRYALPPLHLFLSSLAAEQDGAGERERQCPRQSRFEPDTHGIQARRGQLTRLAARQERNPRNGSGDGSQEAPHRGISHLVHRSLTSSCATSARSCLSCPGCPPRLRPVRCGRAGASCLEARWTAGARSCQSADQAAPKTRGCAVRAQESSAAGTRRAPATRGSRHGAWRSPAPIRRCDRRASRASYQANVHAKEDARKQSSIFSHSFRQLLCWESGAGVFCARGGCPRRFRGAPRAQKTPAPGITLSS